MKREYRVTVEFIEREDGPTLMSVHITCGAERIGAIYKYHDASNNDIAKWLGNAIVLDAREEFRLECGDSDRSVTR